MNILQDVNTTLSSLNIPMETGAYKDPAPDTYLVLTPLSDLYGYHADDAPQIDVQEARLSLYTKANYIATKNSIVSALLTADFVITERRYIEYEPDTGYHHYNIDVEKVYGLE